VETKPFPSLQPLLRVMRVEQQPPLELLEQVGAVVVQEQHLIQLVVVVVVYL
jgi:hypothetical protein